MEDNVYKNETHYFINKRYESTVNKLTDIQKYLVSLVDRILKVVAEMNLRLGYVMELCLRLNENPVYPNFENSRNKTPVPKTEKQK
tara:strand:- start:1002 stop:1259 length:258 start_codon:yes stop_codon:yes gene_type:complete